MEAQFSSKMTGPGDLLEQSREISLLERAAFGLPKVAGKTWKLESELICPSTGAPACKNVIRIGSRF